MFEPIKNLYRLILGDPDLYSLTAKTMALFRDSLMNEGFTREESIQIICANGNTLPKATSASPSEE